METSYMFIKEVNGRHLPTINANSIEDIVLKVKNYLKRKEISKNELIEYGNVIKHYKVKGEEIYIAVYSSVRGEDDRIVMDNFDVKKYL